MHAIVRYARETHEHYFVDQTQGRDSQLENPWLWLATFDIKLCVVERADSTL